MVASTVNITSLPPTGNAAFSSSTTSPSLSRTVLLELLKYTNTTSSSKMLIVVVWFSVRITSGLEDVSVSWKDSVPSNIVSSLTLMVMLAEDSPGRKVCENRLPATS